VKEKAMANMSLTRALYTGALAIALAASAGCSGDDSPPADAVLKFCNGLQRNDNMPVNLTLEYGTTPVKVPISGVACSPQPSQKCLPVPSGKRIPVVVRLESSPDEIFASMVIDVEKGDELIFISTILQDDQMQQVPFLEGGVLRPEVKCDTLDPFSGAPPAPGPAPTPTPRI
jgi:hypothetical protein